jgi:hypothetical protein
VWHFDEGTGTTASDSSGNDYHGTINGATWVDGKIMKGLQFDGVDDFVNMPKVWTTQYTIIGWAKPTTTGIAARHLIESFASASTDNGDGYLIQLWTNDRIYYYQAVNNNFYALITSYPFPHDDTYHQFGMRFTYDGATSKLEGILDGQIVTSRSTTGTPNQSAASSTRIGHGTFAGIIDEVRIYNRALTDAEIKALYEAGR